MELELGLKITHNRDDITSHTNLRIAKDHTGPLFLSRETETMFILIAYLKGFKRENIDIKINKDGNQIAISGTKAVQEMVLSGWIMHKKDVELRAFRKVFRIPDGIILDRIKAKFVDEESSLRIVMPKLVQGIQGIEIEEVKEEQEIDMQNDQPIESPEEKYRDSKNKEKEEIEQAVEKEIERREHEIPQDKIQESEMFPERDKGKVQEKPENNLDTERIVENDVDEGEFKKMEDLSKESVNMESQKKPENEISQKESEEALPAITTGARTKIQESKKIKPKKKVKIVEEEKFKKPEQSELEKATESGNQEPEETVEEPKKSEPDMQGQEIGNEIEEERTDQEKQVDEEDESPEVKKEKESSFVPSSIRV
ncbi:hypothetical protein JCGZ_15197 [Jatropha curcas]|uniref:SHSP domain-containing protein n=1 Tax=Jatropha curcas TaxID=180498 RepID=A0A067K6Z6_JATCU|nr:hypothetical protein JCGZ_15197 [Jatropha curcas]